MLKKEQYLIFSPRLFFTHLVNQFHLSLHPSAYQFCQNFFSLIIDNHLRQSQGQTGLRVRW
ncbi:MAG: hypothetical protein I3273_05720 [Candidatus Moeniiplasma glomeromycotorum]|nr:hypothetical protein [Candidatus Moeniiplasma glomeromycotorum]MCE8168460.1 hypothetical protein [Candidatus Moeniiplasma glomeromycotorum]MCE8169584.1 hypothetical protein [Candidatus Moeniiplasma glomeromycotorum]